MAQSPKSISASDVRFRGDIPETYDRYLGPLLFEPYAADLAARVAKLEPGTVLEIAAGTGILTRQLLAALPKSSRLTATDLNEPMLDVARRKIGVDSRVTWRQADALDLPFAPETFDAVVCQFGVMFFPDKVKGLREFQRVLRPGGRLFINLWGSLDENPHGRIAHAVIGETFRIDPPAFYEVPLGFHDVVEIRNVVADHPLRIPMRAHVVTAVKAG